MRNGHVFMPSRARCGPLGARPATFGGPLRWPFGVHRQKGPPAPSCVRKTTPRAALQTGMVGLSAHWRAVGGSFAQETRRQQHLGSPPPSARRPAVTRWVSAGQVQLVGRAGRGWEHLGGVGVNGCSATGTGAATSETAWAARRHTRASAAPAPSGLC